VPAGFTGTWYGFVSTTYDGGKTWTTVNATPNDPVQRGPICTKGTLGCSGNTRNLLDFNDLTIDGKGRVLAAYADGCTSAVCIQGNDLNGDGKLDGNDNDGTQQATIIAYANVFKLLMWLTLITIPFVILIGSARLPSSPKEAAEAAAAFE